MPSTPEIIISSSISKMLLPISHVLAWVICQTPSNSEKLVMNSCINLVFGLGSAGYSAETVGVSHVLDFTHITPLNRPL